MTQAETHTPLPAKRLQDKVAIITGGGQGIGRAFALRFAREGAHVAVADLNEASAENVAREVRDLGTTGLTVKTDVSNAESVEMMVEQTVEQLGRVDVLINNAAIFSTIKMKPFEEISRDEWDRVMAVNLTGALLCCQAVAPQMRSQKTGRIINISSATVLMGRPYYAHYVTSKAGIIGMTRALANELGSDYITVNAIMPGATETEVPRETVNQDQAKALIASQAIHRRETPEDLVGAAVFLASDDGGFITGQSINIDGGHNFQ
ncbi:MAG: SDR family NAD(P)-dependent oxidoreductase [Rubrobacteraceae bacterium]